MLHTLEDQEPNEGVPLARYLLVILLLGTSASVFADCFDRAAERHRVPANLLRAIACVESQHDPHALNRNANGSIDMGAMQINSWWLPRLKPFGIERDHLWDLCTNVHVGAWVLAQNIKTLGFSWRAIGAYHAGLEPSPEKEERRYAYAQKIHRALDRGC